ncbi:MAG: BCD family MFS transporter [Anaerolineales bacterium]|nr:BCD family MFS transporter [Anaerolineales bacterium]
MRLTRLLRLGLRQFAAGMLSILALGILNRVMKVELGIDLGVVSLVIGLHYFAAPIAIPLGIRSDRHPYFGRHRTPYILAGAALSALMTVAAPHVALGMGATGASATSVAAGAAVFLLLGVGIYSAGTAYLALLVDLTSEAERGRSISIIWSMMMVGILAGVFLGVGLLDAYSAEALRRLFYVMAALLAGLTFLAVVGQEPARPAPPAREAVSNAQAWALLAGSGETRRFFAFLFTGILFLFLQQVVLEPYGGDVLGMSIRQTTLFNAYQMIGVLSGMAIGGAWLSRRLGDRTTAAIGLLLASASFALLAFSSLTVSAWATTPAIVVMGLGMGLFNVGGLAMMMGMSTPIHTGLYMGAWTLSQALANGVASIGGGWLHDAALALSGAESFAYGSVFVIESVGLIAAVAMLARVRPSAFRREALQSISA